MTRFAITRLSLIVIFSSQIIISAFEYLQPGFGASINFFYFTVLCFIFFRIRTRAYSRNVLQGLLLLQMAFTALFISFYHKYLGDNFPFSLLVKFFYIYLSFAIGHLVVMRYNWKLRDFRVIGMWILCFSVVSLCLGSVLGVTASDPTYRDGLLGLTKHPAITAMIISTSLPFVAYYTIGYMSIINFLAVFMIFLTMRRSALIGVLPMYLFQLFSSKSHKFHISILTLLTSIMVFFTSGSGLHFFETKFSRLLNLFVDDTGGSGRIVFWQLLLDDLGRFSIIDMLTGKGSKYITRFLYDFFGAAIGAHNDYLDLVFSYGYIVAILLLAFLLSLLLPVFIQISGNNESFFLKGCLVCLFFFLLIFSLTTGGIFDVQASPIYFSLGLIIGELNQLKSNQELHEN